MSWQDALAEFSRRGQSVQALAALGAELLLRRDGATGDPRVRERLREVVDTLDLSLDELSEPQQSVLLALVRAVFFESGNLLDEPARAPGWTYRDPQLLQAQGLLSAGVVMQLEALAEARPELAAATSRSGRLLDVGTGVARLAIAAAQRWPHLRVLGIDIWQPALDLARQNVAASGLAGRIELRIQDVLELTERDAFRLAWLPAPFLARATFATALGVLRSALEPGGWLVVGQYAIPREPLGRELTRLLVVRSGGFPWMPHELSELLRAAGYEHVECPSEALGVQLVLGRRPA